MPVDGQVCTVQDMNRANARPVPPVADYWDIEGRNLVIVLDKVGKAVAIYEVPSHLARNGEQPVDTKSYCEAKDKDEPVRLVVEDYNGTSNWWMILS